jgi:multiple sugar transport system substrate-binding protein
VLTGLAAVVATALTLGACGGGTGADSGSGDDSGKAKSITLVAAEYSKANTAKFWNDFAAAFKAKTGTELKVQVVDWNDIDQQSSTMIQNGNPPDILNLNAYASYAKDGLLYSADEVLPPAVKSDLIDAFVASGTYNGKLYGMPDLSSARALFYNKTLFQQAGIAAPPKTWAEFEEDAKKITALGNGNVGYAMPLGPEEAQAEFSIWTVNNGGAWKTDGKWSINSPKNVETLTFMKKLADEKVTNNNPGRFNRTNDAFALFGTGKAGMVVGFSPLSATLDTEKKVQYGVAPMPTKDGGPSQTYGVTDYLMAFKKAGNAEAVKAFYELYYQPDQVNTFIKAEGFLPVTKSGLQEFSSQPALKVYLDTLPNIHLTPTDDPTWDKVKIAVQQNIGLGVSPGGNPQKVLDELQAQAEAAS